MQLKSHLIKTYLLLEQRRYQEAENTLRGILAAHPGDVEALALLAECLLHLDRYEEGLQAIERALGVRPDDDTLLFHHARLLLAAAREEEALRQIDNAIQLNPTDADYFGLKGLLLLNMKKYLPAAQQAEQGLTLDAENTNCLNVRAQALIKLKRPEEAYATIATSLEQDPENSYTHANLGWSKLENGRHREALEHLREALRLDPSNDYAKAGMVEAMKAKNPLYRLFLRYTFWMSRLSGQAQWAFIIGLYLLIQVLDNLAVRIPALGPLLLPLVYLYLIFALSTWFIRPLSDLFLFLNPYGRYALKPRQRISALLVGATLLLSLLSLAAYLLTGLAPLMYTAFFFFAMVIPCASMLAPEAPKARRILTCYGAALALTGLLALLNFWTSRDPGLGLFGLLFIGGLFVYQLVANTKMVSRY